MYQNGILTEAGKRKVAARLAFMSLSSDKRQELIKRLEAITAEWAENFAQFEYDQKEKAAQTMTEIMAEYGQDVTEGAFGNVAGQFDSDEQVGWAAYTEKWTAELSLTDLRAEVDQDMTAAKASAAAEETIN